MARLMRSLAFCGLSFVAGISAGQNTPPSWPTVNPVRPETAPGTANSPVYQPNSAAAGQNPATAQPNGAPNDRYPAAQPGNAAINRYQPGTQPGVPPGNQPANPAGGVPDNRFPLQAGRGQPDQPVNPQLPTLERRTAPAAAQTVLPLPPQFQNTEAEQARVDQVLNAWEQKSKLVKTFDCKFVRFEYDLTFPIVDPKAPPGSPPLPNGKDQGILRYATPDKGLYQILYTDKSLNNNWEPAPPERIVHWLCDGNSAYEFDHRESKVIEHPLPPDKKGKAIADGPLPFLFGAEAEKLRQRYYFKLVPAADPKKELWLDVCPKFQQDAANFSCAQLELNLPDMTPKALRLYLPGGKNYNSYVFFDTVVNENFRIFKGGDPFKLYLPRGWEKKTEVLPVQNGQPAQPLQAGRPQSQTR